MVFVSSALGPYSPSRRAASSADKPSGLAANIERFQMMLDANDVPEPTRHRMWGLTMAEVLSIDPKTRRFRG